MHASVSEQLSIAFFVNAVVMHCARDPAVCTLSLAMTVLSSVAIDMKNVTLRASFEASRAKTETALRRECEIEGASAAHARVTAACVRSICIRMTASHGPIPVCHRMHSADSVLHCGSLGGQPRRQADNAQHHHLAREAGRT